MTLDDITISQLAHAVQADDLKQVRAILQVRPDLVNMDTRNNEHRVLHYAVYNRSPEIVRLLMQYGADAHKGIWPIREETTAFTFAVERGYDEIANIIREEERRREQATPGKIILGNGSHREDAWRGCLAYCADRSRSIVGRECLYRCARSEPVSDQHFLLLNRTASCRRPRWLGSRYGVAAGARSRCEWPR